MPPLVSPFFARILRQFIGWTIPDQVQLLHDIAWALSRDLKPLAAAAAAAAGSGITNPYDTDARGSELSPQFLSSPLFPPASLKCNEVREQHSRNRSRSEESDSRLGRGLLYGPITQSFATFSFYFAAPFVVAALLVSAIGAFLRDGDRAI